MPQALLDGSPIDAVRRRDYLVLPWPSFDGPTTSIEYRTNSERPTMTWETIAAPPDAAPPRPMTVRAQSIPARHHFSEHEHRWNQVVYAISGVLTAEIGRAS